MAEFIYNSSLSGFALMADSTTVYEATIASGAPVITDGTIYTVAWDRKRYVCKASTGLEGALYLGDQGINTETVQSGEPFLYRYNADGTGSFRTFDTVLSHTIAISEGQNVPANYLVYERTLVFGEGAEEGQKQSLNGDALPAITAGNKYTVIWDGVYYPCAAKAGTLDVFGEVIILGNGSVNSVVGGENTGEPFLYIYVVAGSQGYFQTLSAAEEHTVSVYDGFLSENRYLMYNQTLEGFALFDDAADNTYGITLTGDSVLPLIGGKTYIVVWDGTVYVCVATGSSVAACIGDVTLMGATGEPNGNPFFFYYSPESAGAYKTTVLTSDTSNSSHTVSVYQLAEQGGWLAKEKVLAFSEVSADGATTYQFQAASSDGGETWADGAGEETQPFLGFPPVPDETYVVVWDGVKYPCKVQFAYSVEDGIFCIVGNAYILEMGDPTGEPFVWLFTAMGEAELVEGIATNDTSAEHTISVYAGKHQTIFENLSLLYDGEEFGTSVWCVARTDASPLEENHEYTININGTEYRQTAKTVLFDGAEVVGIGNAGFAGGEDTGEPFAFAGLDSTGMTVFVLFWLDESTAADAYTVSLYEGDAPASGGDSGGDIVWADPTDVYTYDQNGNAVLHEKRGSVTLDTPDGRYAVFKLSHISDSRS